MTGQPHPPADHEHLVDNGKRTLTLDELAASQPGMDRLMAELPARMHRLGYAGRAGNWPLATYFYRSVVKQLRLCAFSRPRYEPAISGFLAEDCDPVRAAIAARDPSAFGTAYDRMVQRANDYHAEFGKPYLVWRLPAAPPDDLDLTAGLEDS